MTTALTTSNLPLVASLAPWLDAKYVPSASAPSKQCRTVVILLQSQLDFLWIGWPGSLRSFFSPFERVADLGGPFHKTGLDIPEEEREDFSKQLTEQYSCTPVFLSDDIAERYYNGFSNSMLWPLFHYRRAPPRGLLSPPQKLTPNSTCRQQRPQVRRV